MTAKKFRPRAPQQTGPTRKLRTMTTPPSGAQNRKGAATDHSLTYVRARFHSRPPLSELSTYIVGESYADAFAMHALAVQMARMVEQPNRCAVRPQYTEWANVLCI